MSGNKGNKRPARGVLGVNIRNAIEQAGMTQRGVAEYLGLDEATISQLVRGSRQNPTLQILLGIAMATNTTTSKLLEGL